ncbi:hypothetical protein SDC9_137334 [bioreactor metagenome]|uniref:Uncharacterized protein n=1 Tax=bioreactor metagenome TaxID=1076179 RepID=A0A645DLL1_9ZZZZ
MSFGNGDLVITDVDDKQCIGQTAHILDAADRLLQLFHFTTGGQRFALGQTLDGTIFNHGFHFFQALDRLLDGLEVGQHAAEPALVNVRHAGATRFFGEDLASLTLGADKQDIAAIGGQLAHEVHGFVVLHHRLFEIDDVDFVAMTEDVRGHTRIPETGLVAEVNTGFQHFAHGNGHSNFLLRVEPPPAGNARHY